VRYRSLGSSTVNISSADRNAFLNENLANEAPKGEKAMDMRKKTAALAALVFVGLLAGPCSPAWPGDSKSAAANTSTTLPSQQDSSQLSILSSVFTDAASAPRKRDTQCRASQIYSQHDVVGDPEACIMNRATFGGGAPATGVP
jgi:hypothetical protein